jgi:hypothetical protein
MNTRGQQQGRGSEAVARLTAGEFILKKYGRKIKYCNVLVGSITLKVQYTTLDYSPQLF